MDRFKRKLYDFAIATEGQWRSRACWQNHNNIYGSQAGGVKILVAGQGRVCDYKLRENAAAGNRKADDLTPPAFPSQSNEAART